MNSEEPVEKPKWLIDIQNNSWNPELLISGLSIVFLFSVSDQISEISIWLIQGLGLNPVLVYFASIYVSLAFTSLQYIFAIHLVLRGLWIGWVGLNYVFPKGIQFDKLPKINRQDYIRKEIGNPVSRVLLLERVCSSTFGLAFTFVGISVFILFFFVIAFVLETFGLGSGTVLLILFGMIMLISAIVPLNYYLSKWRGVAEIKFLSNVYRLISRVFGILFFRDSLMTYQTNIAKVPYYFTLTFLFFFMAILSSGNIVDTVRFSNFALTEYSLLPSKDRHSKTATLYNNYYFDRNEKNLRIQKACIPSFQINENVLEVFIADYRWDKNVFEEVMKTDTLDYSISPLVKIKIDGHYVKPNWYRNEHPSTNQNGWITYIPLDQKLPGERVLTIDKWLWNYEDQKGQFEEQYCIIPFWKE